MWTVPQGASMDAGEPRVIRMSDSIDSRDARDSEFGISDRQMRMVSDQFPRSALSTPSGLEEDRCFSSFRSPLSSARPIEARLTTSENPLEGRDSAFGISDRQIGQMTEMWSSKDGSGIRQSSCVKALDRTLTACADLKPRLSTFGLGAVNGQSPIPDIDASDVPTVAPLTNIDSPIDDGESAFGLSDRQIGCAIENWTRGCHSGRSKDVTPANISSSSAQNCEGVSLRRTLDYGTPASISCTTGVRHQPVNKHVRNFTPKVAATGPHLTETVHRSKLGASMSRYSLVSICENLPANLHKSSHDMPAESLDIDISTGSMSCLQADHALAKTTRSSTQFEPGSQARDHSKLQRSSSVLHLSTTKQQQIQKGDQGIGNLSASAPAALTANQNRCSSKGASRSRSLVRICENLPASVYNAGRNRPGSRSLSLSRSRLRGTAQ